MFVEFKSFLDKIPEGGAISIEGVVENDTLALKDSNNGNVIAVATKDELNSEINAIRDFFDVIGFDPRQLVRPSRHGIIIGVGRGSLPDALAEILAKRGL